MFTSGTARTLATLFTFLFSQSVNFGGNLV